MERQGVDVEIGEKEHLDRLRINENPLCLKKFSKGYNENIMLDGKGKQGRTAGQRGGGGGGGDDQIH